MRKSIHTHRAQEIPHSSQAQRKIITMLPFSTPLAPYPSNVLISIIGFDSGTKYTKELI